MKLSYKKFDLPLRHVFTISRGSVSVQQTLIVQLESDGKYGYGESTTNTFYGATIENMSSVIESVRSMIEQATLEDPLALIAAITKNIPHEKYANFALNAIDLAIHDLWGKLRGAPVYKLWGLTTDRVPDSDYTLGIDTPEKMVAKMQEMPGWPVYKIKLGTADDLTIVRELRKHTDALFRVDANCGWTAEQTIEFAPVLKKLNVEFIEQPLPPEDVDGARRAFEGSVLPLIADENCIVESDVDRCAGRFHGINIKLTKCGGLAPARRMAARARELDLQVMAGCMTESTVGISAIAQLLPLLDYVDMDGAVLIAKDIATGARLDHGKCIYPNANGNGVQLIDGPF
ncbi:MAG TPA: dipeptide epimerase [Lacipirellulaceae bacterium]|jgi:L-alanine-DL-glutamate epimerase-like enolase superfamily enzyme|nr:dipeptide epimerase [Lacipirellulaceae bacterium]